MNNPRHRAGGPPTVAPSDLTETVSATGSERRHPRRTAALVVAGLPVALILVAGCGRLRHDATPTPTVASPTTTAAPPAASTPTTAAAGSGAAGQTLNSIEQQLSTVNSQLSSVGGDLSTADSAINSQEGDPSK